MIETSEPVGYVVTRPDPLTMMVDFRNVGAEGMANSVIAKSPIAGRVGRSRRVARRSSSRVRITLTQPVAHHVRSDRNSVVVDLERPTGRPYVLPAGVDPSAEVNQSPAVDPIAALGLNAPAPVASPANAAPATVAQPGPATATQPVVSNVQGGLAGLRAQQAALQAPGPQAPAPAAGQAPAQGDQAAPRRFTGNPISLDFQGADLRAVLRTFSPRSAA